MSRSRLIFCIVAAVLTASRLCHVSILWEGDTLPLATAGQMLKGHALYRGIWFDKPPLLPLAYLLAGGHAGWALRIGDALFAMLACWLVYRFARDLWSEREGLWAAGLLAFFLTFDVPSAVIPVASDLMMVAPHIAAVWMAYRKRPYWSGVLAAVAFWISPKGLLVAAVCAVWDPRGVLWMAAGFASFSGVMVGWLAATGSLSAYWEEVWKWGRLYAGSPFVESPVKNGLIRTANWAGFHAAIVIAAGWFAARGWRRGDSRAVHWVAWLAISLAGVAVGMRFFPRYYFLLLPVVVLMAARGFLLIGPRRELVALLMLIPLSRFGPAYLAALTNPVWRDIGMDRDSRAASSFLKGRSSGHGTLFIWGYRPEIYVYTGMEAATAYLDSQPLTGVPADRHLTQSEPVETVGPARRRMELTGSKPDYVVDGLGPYNPNLAITNYPELRKWLEDYSDIGHVGQTVIYQRTPGR